MKEKTNLDVTVDNVHSIFQKTPSMISHTSSDFNGGGTLHYAIENLKSPKIVAYLLCRGKNVIIEGIDCSALPPMDLNLQNSAGETALELAEIELLKSPTYTDIDDKVAIKLINNFIKLAKKGNFEKIAHKMEHYEAAYNTEKNILLAKPKETDIAKEPTPPKIRFKEEDQLIDTKENTMPHYPSFDKEWKEQDSANIRRSFISAYRNDNFPLMQKLIHTYKIKFKGSDTVSELAYEAIDHNCIHMTYELVNQGSANPDYTPKKQTESLKDKYNNKKAQIKKAQTEADLQVKEALATNLKRHIDVNSENKDLINSPPKKSKPRHRTS